MKTKFYRYFNLFSLTIFACINFIYAQNAVYLSSITQNLVTPVRIVIDNTDIIYVSDASRKLISKYNKSGSFLGTITLGGAPLSIAFNKNNQIFIGDGETGYILKLDSNGTPAVFYTGTLFPSDMVFISDSVYVVDSELRIVIVLDQSGSVVRRIGTGTFTSPAGITFNPKNNRLLVSEHGGMGGVLNPVVKVWMFGLTGNLIGSFGSHGSTNGKFYRIQGLDVDRCGNIYIPDPYLGRVSVFNQNGAYITKFGTWGDDLGQLNIPLDIEINSNDSVWITSMNNGALDVYKISYTLPTSNITTGNATVCFGGTTDIPVDFTGTSPWNFTYTVNDSDTTIVTNVTDNPYVLTASAAGTYKVIAISDSGNTGTCFSGSVDLIADSTLPTSNISSGDTTICSGDTTDITIDFIGTPPWTFTYTINDLNPEIVSNTSDNPYILSVTQAGTYKITALSDSGNTGTCFSRSATITVDTVIPSSNITSGNKTICLGTTDITIALTGTPPWTLTYTIDSLTPTTVSNVTDNPYLLTVSQAGTYEITAISGAGCSGILFTGSSKITIDTTLPASAITSGNDTICAGETTGISIDFTGVSPWTFTYTIDSLNPATVSNVSVTPYMLTVSDSGIYEITALSGAGCTGTSFTGSAGITVKNTATGTDSATICNGNTYTFGTQTLTTSGTYNEIFTAANGCDSAVTLTLTVDPAITETVAAQICEGSTYTFGTQTLTTSGTYNEIFTAANGCDSAVALTLTVNPLPTSGITSGNKTICSGTTDIIIDFTGIPPWTFTYTIDSLNSTTVSATPDNPYLLTVSAAGTYKVSALSDAFCTGTGFTGSATIIIDSVLPASAITSGNDTICSGETTDIIIDFTGISPWTFTYTIDSLNPTTVSNTVDDPYILTVSDAGRYEVIALSGGGCAGTSFMGSAKISVDTALPASNIISGNDSICSGKTTGITINFTGTPPWTFTYTIDSLTPTIVSNVMGNPYILTVSGAGIYEVIALSGAGCTGTSFTGNAEITVNPLPTVGAGADEIICSGTTLTLSGTGAVSYLWDNGVTDGIAFTSLATTNYTVTGTDANGCTNTDAVLLTVNSLPPVNAGIDYAVCNGTVVALTGSGAVSYLWDNGVTDGVAFTPVATIIYNVTGTDANGCTNTDAVLLTVNSLPAVDAGIAQQVCIGTSVTLSGSGAASYIWDNGVTDGIAFTPVATTIYNVTGTDGNGCTNNDAVLVTVNSLPVVGGGVDQAVCSGTSITLLGSGAVSYIWDNGVTDGVAFTPASTTTYTVAGTDANGCTNTDAVLLTVNSLPPVDAGIDYAVCNGTSVTLTGSGAVSYLWDNGVTDGVAFTPVVTTIYNVTGTDGNGCTNTDAVLVTVNPILIGTDAAAICQGNAYTFGTQTLTSAGIYNETFVAANGCDSVVTLILTINPTATTTASAAICQGNSYIFGTQTLDSSGVYNEIFNSVSGCDSTVTLTLTVNPVPVPDFSYTANGFEITFVNNSLNAGSYLWDFG
ncbi:MAG: NHL repeat-containing protein, partial [Bacteroidetes bacterium]|nr:NHL repeat-containing protein [Bacteroidota bacterium]